MVQGFNYIKKAAYSCLLREGKKRKKKKSAVLAQKSEFPAGRSGVVRSFLRLGGDFPWAASVLRLPASGSSCSPRLREPEAAGAASKYTGTAGDPATTSPSSACSPYPPQAGKPAGTTRPARGSPNGGKKPDGLGESGKRLCPRKEKAASGTRPTAAAVSQPRRGAHQKNTREQRFAFRSGLGFTSGYTGCILPAGASAVWDPAAGALVPPAAPGGVGRDAGFQAAAPVRTAGAGSRAPAARRVPASLGRAASRARLEDAGNASQPDRREPRATGREWGRRRRRQMLAGAEVARRRPKVRGERRVNGPPSTRGSEPRRPRARTWPRTRP